MTFRERLFLRRLRERDERAFREMVEQNQDQIFNLLYRMIGSREEAEDLAQEVFVTVFKSVDQFRGDAKLSTWLYRIAVNHCKNRQKYLARRHQKATAVLDEAAERLVAVQGGQAIAAARIAGPDQLLEEVEREQIVQRAISLLEEDHRVVIILRDIEELSYEEIAQITGLPEGTIKSRLHRARVALKEKLRKYL